MRLEKTFRRIPGAIPAGHCDHVRSCRLLEGEANSPQGAGGREAEHGLQAGVPDRGTPSCLCRLRPRPAAATWREPLAAGRRGPSLAVHYAAPARPGSPRSRRNIISGRQCQSQKWRWASGGAASPGKPISTRIDYGTESVVISHITSARAQCKSHAGRSSCGIVPTDGAMSAIRASQVGP
jgi:hypothetical protein